MNTDELAPIDHEPKPQDSLKNGVDLVCFSGDKLLGGPQSGIIAGKTPIIEGIKKEPFFRAVRCDKLILTVLQECIDTYLDTKSNNTTSKVPALDFIGKDISSLQQRAEAIIEHIPSDIRDQFTIAETTAEREGARCPSLKYPQLPSP